MRVNRRGVSLLEGLVSGVILAIGLTGALQGILVASQQNSLARRMTTLSSAAHEIQLGVQGRRRATLESSVFAASACRPVTALNADERRMLGSLDNAGLSAPVAPVTSVCAVDLDAWEASVAVGNRLTPRWAVDAIYRRWLVYAVEAGGAATVYIAVSTRNALSPGSRLVHTQFVGLYDASPAGNGAGVEL